MEQFLMFVEWIVFGVWMYACIGKPGCFRCVIIRYTLLIVCLILTSALL